ncbi:MAG: hypothetical protein Q8J88_00170 [Bacteroidales bacterium]|nr:hypothetical protein [Bacteroidales bacterium]
MKHLTFTLVLILFLANIGSGQNNVGINDDNSTAKASAMLDIFSSTKGLLIPRMMLTSTTTAAPVTSPEASLMVYNTATTGDVTPGYYYWNGTSKWVRLVASSDPAKNFNAVEKSVSTTLLKTENMVFASGNITLTLPSITSADDGLEIAVKNVGTFTDLIIVVPEAGKLIDVNASSSLTRWHGRTFIARGSNWVIREKEIQTDNNLEVSTIGSFTTIPEVVAFLNVHMAGPTVVILGAGTYPVDATVTINLPYPVTFQGLSYGATTIAATAGVSGSPLFICQTECSFKMIMFTAISNTAGNDALRFTGNGIHHEVKDNRFSGFNKGIVSMTNNDLWIFENDFQSCAAAGIEIAAGAASGGRLRISETDFIQCAKGINLLSGVGATISILNCAFYNTNSGTDIGILYTPATFTSYASMFITNNAWNNQGTFMSGFDFSLESGRDANIFLTNNSGTKNEIPHARISVRNNVSTTTITTANTFYKAVWAANTTTFTCKWGIGSTSPASGNRITYQPDNSTDVWAVISGNLSNSANNQVIIIAIVKNGVTTTRYGETDLRITVSNQPFQFSTVVFIPDIIKGDYLELYATSSQGGNNITFQDIQWFTNTK